MSNDATMRRLILIFFLLSAFALSVDAQDKLYGYTYKFSKHVDWSVNILFNKHVRPNYEQDTLYFVYSSERNAFARATDDGVMLTHYYIEYNNELRYYRVESERYATLGEFISPRFDVFMVLRYDDAAQYVYDVYLLTSIKEVE